MSDLNNFKELEYKYSGDDVELQKFQALMKELQFKKVVEVSSWDVYYTNERDEFIRFRNSANKPELTIKRKTTETNNQDRIEINLPVDTNREDLVEVFANYLGYKKNFKVYKSCFIYFFEDVDVVYYIVYDENLKERGRFIEIEILENETAVKMPFDLLKKYEQKLSCLGITAQNRMRKSLFELFKTKKEN